MGELSCGLSTLVFAELYRLLSSNQKHRVELEKRLDDLGYDLDWVATAADAYDARWRADADYLTPETAHDFALPVEHALLATWILAGLRNRGDSYELSGELRAAVGTRMVNETPALAGHRPTSLSPIIRGWTLGMVAGTIDAQFPIVPAQLPADPHIGAAYKGLVELVLHLGSAGEPWPELAGTALLVRTGGLAEALRPPPERRGLNHSIQTLMGETSRQVPLHIQERLRSNWTRWVERRNVLTHVKPDEDASESFEDAAGLVRAWHQIELTIIGISQFICQEVSLELFESTPPALRNDPWDYLQRGIEVW